MFFHISAQEKIQLVQNLALLLDSGVPIYTALTTLESSQVSPRAKKMLRRLAKGTENGEPLHVLVKKERSLSTVFSALIEAGEVSGTLSHHLSVLAKWLEHEHTTRTNIKSALLYPKIILSATLMVAGGLAVFVLPKLLPIFQTMRIELPLSTRILLFITTFMQSYWHFLLVGVGLAVLSYVLLMRVPAVRYARDTLHLKIPLIGTLERAYEISLSTRIIATLYESGLTLPRAVRISAHTATNTVYAQAWQKMADKVERGEKFAELLEQYPHLFYGDVITLAAVGEHSGSFATTFTRIADFYQQRIDTMTKRLPSVIEPLLLVVMTFLVGFVAVAIILPVYEFTQGTTL